MNDIELLLTFLHLYLFQSLVLITRLPYVNFFTAVVSYLRDWLSFIGGGGTEEIFFLGKNFAVATIIRCEILSQP
jgi:hypothetical protein